MSDVANQFGYSKWHFCSKFHNYTGKSFVKYVRHYRLQLAALEILSGKKSTDVAFKEQTADFEEYLKLYKAGLEAEKKLENI